MKFTTNFQCLMGGNAVQFHDQSSSSSVVLPTTRSSSIVLPADNYKDDKKNNSMKKTSKKTKKKKKKKMDGRKVIRVFRPDGKINLYNKPIRVSEVMVDEYMVCRSDSFYIGQKIPPLSQHERLERGHTYFLLPAHLFHTVLSFVTIASFTASKEIDMHDTSSSSNAANMKMKAAFLKKAAASSCSPFDIQKTPSGTLSIRVSEMFISQLMMEQGDVASSSNDHRDDQLLMDQEVAAAADILCTTPQLHREYKQLVVGSRRGWKPKLEMIKETPPKGKRKVKLLLSASISRMKKKMKKNKNVGVPHIWSSSSSTSAASKKSTKKNKKTIKPVVSPIRPSSSSVKANKFSKIQ